MSAGASLGPGATTTTAKRPQAATRTASPPPSPLSDEAAAATKKLRGAAPPAAAPPPTAAAEAAAAHGKRGNGISGGSSGSSGTDDGTQGKRLRVMAASDDSPAAPLSAAAAAATTTTTTTATPSSLLSASMGFAAPAPAAAAAARRPLSMSSGSVNTTAAKKLVIKGFKAPPQLPANFEEETWQQLREAVRAIHEKRPVAASFEGLYKAVENLCLHKLAAGLYRRLQGELEAHLQRQYAALTAQATLDDGEALAHLNGVWEAHCQDMLLIRSIFLYLDRTYVLQSPGVRSLWELGLQLFRTGIAARPEMEQRAVRGALALIERERRGEAVDRAALKTTLRMLAALQMYGDAFERPFLEASRVFYAAEGAAMVLEHDVPHVLRHIEARLAQEGDRVLHYLEPFTRKPLVAVVEKQLLEAHVAALLAKGFERLMDEQRGDDLARLYALLARVGALEPLKAAWKAYVKAAGARLVQDPQKDEQLVQQLLDFRAALLRLLHAAMQGNEAFHYALKEAFESFINSRANRPAELIAKYVDQHLRAGNKSTSEDELEGVLDNAIALFRFINGKDIFEAFYKKALAKRLLLGKSASIDAEKAMVAKLKIECGSQFTMKLEGMFKDMEASTDLMAQYRASPFARRPEARPDIDLVVYVLTHSNWPTYAPLECLLPRELAEPQEMFKQFYLSKSGGGRKLMWQNSLGHCTLKAAFPRGRKELAVSLFQGTVLMLFNNTSGSLTYDEIKQATGIEEKELKRTLLSLACHKVRVLSKTPKNKEIDMLNDVFAVNDDFEHKLVRIKINSIQLKETVEEQQKTNEEVFQDRIYQIDAAVVRIMKTRKTLTHNLLVAEIYNQIKFPLKASDLKKRIESLIEREYLERDAANSSTYNYVS